MIERINQVSIVVDDLEAATVLFVEPGLELEGKWPAEGQE